MKTWTQIDEIQPGDFVLRSNGLKAKPSQVKVLSLKNMGTYARMTWTWSDSSDHYYSTDFRKSTGIADYGLWHDLTTQQWAAISSIINDDEIIWEAHSYVQSKAKEEMIKKNVLLVTVIKSSISGIVAPIRLQFISTDKNRIINFLENKYRIKLIKNEKDDFPYFTDGGFKFSVDDVNKQWHYEIDAHIHEII